MAAMMICTPALNGMQELLLYVHVAFGAFMSYVFTPTLTKDQHFRVILESLVAGDKKERATEAALLLVSVFAGGYLAFVFMEPCTLKQAVTFGLGWTSVASIGRTSFGYAVASRSRQSASKPSPGDQGKKPAPKP